MPAAANNIDATAPDAPGNLQVRYDSNGDGSGKLTLTWTAAWHNGSPLTRYEVRRAEGASVPDPATWLSRIDGVTIGLDTAFSANANEGTTWTYQVRAENGEGGGGVAEITVTLTDNRAPRPGDLQVEGNGQTLSLTFDEALDETLPAETAFTVTVSAPGPAGGAGEARTPDSLNLASDAAELHLILAEADAIRPGETVTVTYAPPTGQGANPVQDAAGNDVAGFADLAAANGLPVAAPAAPGNLTAEPGSSPAPWR